MHPLFADSYTISSDPLISEKARRKSIYSLINRIAPIHAVPDLCKDSRMVLYGVSDFIKSHLLKPITHEDIDESVEFMRTAHCFGGPLPFPEEIWRRIVNEYEGYLPISIRGLKEGSTFFPNEPVIQVESYEGFGEIAAHIEALLVGMVACTSARATITRHFLEKCKDYLRSIKFSENPSEIENRARFMIHDFGMRASSTEQESNLFGRAHLLSFYGTDTFNAAFSAWKDGAKRPTGTSIVASAHRIICGHPSEDEAFQKIVETGRKYGKICTFVTDCYNMEKGRERLVRLAKENPDTLLVFKDDSGDYIENTHKVIPFLRENKNMNFLMGDSMNPTKVDRVLEICRPFGIIPTFGIGGWLRNTATRDLFSASYKLAAIGDYEPSMKIAEVDGKRSVPGPNKVKRSYDDSPSVFMYSENVDDAMVNHYEYVGSGFYSFRADKFPEIQERTIRDFGCWEETAKRYPYFGGNRRQILSQKTLQVSDELYQRHR